MLTREERHALAARIRLGEASCVPDHHRVHTKLQWWSWSSSDPAHPDKFVEYALGVAVSFIDLLSTSPPTWENGDVFDKAQRHPFSKRILEYLERD